MGFWVVMRRLCVGFGGVWCVGRGVLLGAGGVGVDGVVRSTDLKMVRIFLAFWFLTYLRNTAPTCASLFPFSLYL